MKRIILPLLAIMLLVTHAPAAEAPPRATTISVNLDNSPLDHFLKIVQESCNLRMAFAHDVVANARPVTLHVEDADLDWVLHAALAPSGLEIIDTGETMAAILPAATDEGMAKAAGRALRAFARLERKLEKAVQVADEVKVPDWTPADDRALAEGIVDLATAANFYSQRKRETGGKPFHLARMLNSFDKDVRVGACVPAENFGQATLSADSLAALEAAVLKTVDDADPEIRAVGVFTVCCLRRHYGDKWVPVVEKAIAASAKDPAPEPRFAAVVARAAAGLPTPSMEMLASELRTDPNPSVGAVAWLLWLDKQRRNAGPELVDDFRKAILAEKNPILKSLGVIMALMVWERNPETIAELCNSSEVQGDPWLKVSADVMLGIVDLMVKGRDASRSKDEGPAAEVYTEARRRMLDSTMALLTSGKRSHQLLAGLSAMFGMRAMVAPPQKEPKPDLSKITALADSADLWERFIGVMISAAANDQPGMQRVLNALESKDPLDRIFALFACVMSRPSPNADADADAETAELSRKLTATLLAFLKSPVLAEQYLAAQAIRWRVPFDDLLAMLQDEIRRDPNSELAKVLVKALGTSRELMMGGDELRKQRQLMALDVVLESKNAELELLFIETIRWRGSSQNQPMLLTLICDCQPKVLTSMLMDRNSWSELRNEDYAVRAVLDRLKTMFAQGDAETRPLAARGLAAYMQNAHKLWDGEEFKLTTLELLTRMLDAFILQGNTPEQFAAGCDLLCGAIGPRGPVADLPAGIRAAIVRVLGAAGDPARSAKVAAVLHHYYSRGGEDPELAPVIEAAREKIMASDLPAEQAVVLCGMVMWGNERIRNSAVAEIEKRLMAGTVPAANRKDTIEALSRSDTFSDGFVRFAFGKLADPAEEAEVRKAVLGLFATKPAFYGGLFDVLAEMAKSGEPVPIYTPMLGSFSQRLGEELAKLKQQNQPAPAWAAKAAEIGLHIMNDAARTPFQRARGIELYGRVAGPAASAAFEKIALDPKADADMRRIAAAVAIEANPQSDVLASLAETYVTLPRMMRMSLGPVAARARNVNTPGAEALLIAYLKDTELEGNRTEALFSLQPPVSAAIMTALKELEQDRVIGQPVRNAIRRLEQKE